MDGFRGINFGFVRSSRQQNASHLRPSKLDWLATLSFSQPKTSLLHVIAKFSQFSALPASPLDPQHTIVFPSPFSIGFHRLGLRLHSRRLAWHLKTMSISSAYLIFVPQSIYRIQEYAASISLYTRQPFHLQQTSSKLYKIP